MPADLGPLHPSYRPPVRHIPALPAGGLVASESAKHRAQRMALFRQVCVRRAREDFGAFLEYAMRDAKSHAPFAVQWFQEEWIAAITSKKRVQIIAPRSHGKSSLAAVALPIWELGRDHNKRIKIVCEDDELAGKRLRAIRRHIAHNPRVQDVFPSLKPDPREAWAATKLTVERNMIDPEPSIEAKGIMSGATGSRVDLMIADDVVGKRNALLQGAARERVKVSFYDDWMNLLDPRSRAVAIATLWHKDDLNHELQKNREWAHLFYAVGDAYESLWPERWPADALAERHRTIGTAAFSRGYWNRCQDDSEAVVREAWIRYMELDDMPPLNELILLDSYDTAKSQGPDADYTAEVLLAVHPPTGHMFVLDAQHRRATRAEQSDWVWGQRQRFRPFRIQIEDIGADLADWVEHDHPELVGEVERIKPRISKALRLESVTPYLERGEVWFAAHLDPDDPRFRPARGSLVGELLDFPLGKHDDLVDALSQAIHAAQRLVLDTDRPGEGTLDATVTLL